MRSLRRPQGWGIAVSTDRELAVLGSVVSAIDELESDAQLRVVQYLIGRFGVGEASPAIVPGSPFAANASGIADKAKDFMAQKKPRSAMERVVCLAYWLDRHGTSAFASGDLSQVNLEAAGPKFDIVEAGKWAAKRGLFAPAPERKRQITSLGEQMVEALPDRDAVTGVMDAAPRRRRPKPRPTPSN
jgi:hypothetical protein